MKQLYARIMNIVIYFFPVIGIIRLQRLVNEPGNEMWRAGGGFHGYQRYFRIDIGERGWRWTRSFDWCRDYFNNVYPHCTPEHQRELDQYLDDLLVEGVLNPENYAWMDIARGQAVTRERVDLYPKLWVKGKSLHRITYMK